jgi:hypothetical protein
MKRAKRQLTPERIAELEAQGLFDLNNHNWYLQVDPAEWSLVYTRRAHARHWAWRRADYARAKAARISHGHSTA